MNNMVSQENFHMWENGRKIGIVVITGDAKVIKELKSKCMVSFIGGEYVK